MRDDPKSSCESHDTGLGITFFDAGFEIKIMKIKEKKEKKGDMT